MASEASQKFFLDFDVSNQPISEFGLHYWRQIIFFTVPLSKFIFLVKMRARNFFSKISQPPPPPRISNGPCLNFCRSGTVNLTLFFTTKVMVSISILRYIPSLVATFCLCLSVAFLFHSLYDMQGIYSYYIYFGDHATFQWTIKIVIKKVL